MARVALGSKAVGSAIKLKVNGTYRDFIVAHKGKPGDVYDDSCDGVWLLIKDCYVTHRWNSKTENYYPESEINSWLNGELLGLFEDEIKAQIKQVKIPYRNTKNNNSYGATINGENGLPCRVFLLASVEVGFVNGSVGIKADMGETLDYFNGCIAWGQDPRRVASINGSNAVWYLRDSPTNSANGVAGCKNDGAYATYDPVESKGIRFALIMPSTLAVDDDGTVKTNTAPTTPASVLVPEDILGGTSVTVTWGTSTDPDNDQIGYEMERQVDGGEWTQFYKGEKTSYTDTITRGWLTVAYRVRAYDNLGLYSDYTTSPTREVNNNRAPAITCATASDADLGVKGEGFSVAYSAADADGDPMTVTEAIDGGSLRTFTPGAGEACTFAITGETFMKLLNGAHELTITANDGQAEAVHRLAFTKSVTAASITLETPMEADGKITLCVLSVTGSIPEDAVYTVKVANNALDSEPVWEDCTDAVKIGANHVFANETAVNGFAFNFKVEVERGESGESGCINSVQGGFQ